MNETTDLSRAEWFKSSFSNGQGGDCVEAAATSRAAHGGQGLQAP